MTDKFTTMGFADYFIEIAGQHLLDSIETVLSGSPLIFIPHPSPSAA